MTDICLFQNKTFIGASGKKLDWKVECDAIPQPGNWEWGAKRVSEQCRFHTVYGIANGGLLFADACEQYKTTDPSAGILIVDDVWTTGHSIIKFYSELPATDSRVYIWVMFSRNPDIPWWVRALWSYTGGDIKQRRLMEIGRANREYRLNGRGQST